MTHFQEFIMGRSMQLALAKVHLNVHAVFGTFLEPTSANTVDRVTFRYCGYISYMVWC